MDRWRPNGWSGITAVMGHPDLFTDWAALIDLWSDRRQDRALPDRSDFVAEDFAAWFGELGLVDVVEGDPPRFRVRLAGTGITLLDRRETTGRFLDEVTPEPTAETALRPYFVCVARACPVLDDIRIEGRAAFSRVRRLVLPLGGGGAVADVRMVLAAVRSDPPAHEVRTRDGIHAVLASLPFRQETTVLADERRSGS